MVNTKTAAGIDPAIVDKTVWIVHSDGEWQAMRRSGEVLARNRYQEYVMRDMRRLAADSRNGVMAIATVQEPYRRKPRINRPLVPPRPR